MSSAIVTRGSKLFSNDQVTPILNSADFWLDMSDSSKFTTLSTTRINTITDKSATPKTITRSGDISYDTVRTGIKATGTAGTDFLTINLASPATATTTNETIFAVAYTNNTGTSAILGGTATGTRSFYISGTGFQYGRQGGTAVGGGTTIPMQTMVVGCVQSTSSSNVNFYQNGRYIISGNPGANTASSATQSILRSGGVTTFWLRGAVYELLIFTSALTTTQINVVNHYLMNKWKIVTSTTSLISSPLSITSSPCTLWLDGNDASTITYGSGTSVAQWSDKSGNLYHAIQNTAANQPTYDSTLKGVLFTGVNGSFLPTTCPFSPTETVFIVANADSSATYYILLGSSNDSYGRHFNFYNGGGWLRSNATTLYTSSISTLSTTEKYLIHYTNNGTTGFFEVGYNTVQDSNSTTAFTYQAGSYTNIIGGATSTGGIGNTYNSYVYEVIIFNSGLSVADRRSICAYLVNKWGITNNAPRTDTYLYPFYNSRPFTRSFTPLDFDGCRLWIDAGDASTVTLGGTGGTVSAVLDKSGNGFNLSSGNNFSYPNNTFNGTRLPSFYYTGNTLNSRIGLNASLSVAQPVTHFLVAQKVGGTSTIGPYAFDGTTRNWFYHPSANNQIAFGAGTGLASYNMPTTTFIACAVANGASSQLIFNGNIVVTGNAGANAFAGIRLGGAGGGADPYNGHICEYLCFNRILSTSERTQIESYLAQKWRLVSSLPVGHIGRLYTALSVPFEPRSINNLSLWLDGSDLSTITLVGSSVSVWNDKSGNSCVASQFTPSKQATWTNRGIQFSSSNWYDMTNVIYTATHSVFFVGTPSTTPGYLIGRNPAAGGGPTIIGGFTGTSLEFYDSTQRYTIQATPTGTFIAGYTRRSGGNIIGFYNAVSRFTQAQTNDNGLTPSWVYLNASQGDVYADTGNWKICEIVIYNIEVSTAQRQRLEGYLAHKWGLQNILPSTHPFKKITP